MMIAGNAKGAQQAGSGPKQPPRGRGGDGGDGGDGEGQGSSMVLHRMDKMQATQDMILVGHARALFPPARDLFAFASALSFFPLRTFWPCLHPDHIAPAGL